MASQTSQDGVGGCSRTSGTSAAAPVDVDALPSTSATSSTSTARCHYAAASSSKIVARQVNASAQTQERFLARSGLTGTVAGAGAGAVASAGLGAIAAAAAVAAGGSAGLSNAVVRPRRRVEATRSANSDVIVLEVVVEENGNNNGANAAPAAAAAGSGNNNDAGNLVEPGDFNAEEPWGNCDEENNCSDLEEICTCQNSMLANSRSGSNASLSETLDMDATDGYHHQQQPQSVEESSSSLCTVATPFNSQQQQRKRKYNDGRLLDGEYSISATGSAGAGNATAAGAGLGAGNAEAGDNSRKRIAYDFTSTPRSLAQTSGATSSSVMLSMTPTSSANLGLTHGLLGLGSSPALGRRTPRSLMATHDNPPAELQHWLGQFQRWSHAERLVAVDRLIDNCDPSQVRHMMKVIEPQFQRDFISLLPRELALFVLSYLDPKDLLRAAQTCRSWRFLCDDNLLWKEKCRKAQILTESRSDRPKRGRDGNMPPIASPWKAAYMRQHIIEMNWRSRPVRKPKVLKGHDDHVITCLQFSGNRIVSGSDDNTLKVWSAVNGKVSEGKEHI